MITEIRRIFAVAAIAAAVFTAGPAFAAWPERPLTMLVPFAAGGGTDANARIVSSLLERELGVSVNVVNRTGGSGVIGHKAIAEAAPDGYTIGYIVVELSMMHWAGLTELTYKDLQPLAGLTAVGGSLQVRSDAPYKTIDELIQAIRANPGKFKASGSGQGGIWHLALAGMLKSLGIDPATVTWVPHQGAAPAIQDLAAGGLDMVVCAPAEARAMLDAKRVRSLAVLSSTPSPVIPDTPTLKQAINADWSLDAWGGVAGPKGMPADVVAKLVAALRKVYDSAEFKDYAAKRGTAITFRDPPAFAAFLADMDKNFGDVMKAVGIAKK